MPTPRRKTKKRKSGWPPLIIAVLLGGASIIEIILHSSGNDGTINLFSTTATRTPSRPIVTNVSDQTATETVSAMPGQTDTHSPEMTELSSATNEAGATEAVSPLVILTPILTALP
jgi:hypothetical protein